MSGSLSPEAARLGRSLAEPWGGALLRLLADPLQGADPAALPALPGVESARALAAPVLRGKLGRILCDGSADALAAIGAAAEESPRARLALAPPEEAVAAMALATAWVLAPQIGMLIRLAEVRRAREALGEVAYTFATRRAAMMPRPTEPLLTAIGAIDTAAELARLPELRAGAALFGLACGPLPEALLGRLRLRRPVAAWTAAAAHARPDPAGEAAFSALRRLLRDRPPAWSSWLS